MLESVKPIHVVLKKIRKLYHSIAASSSLNALKKKGYTRASATAQNRWRKIAP